MKVPEGMSDDSVVFLTDILPTGYQAAVNADIKPGSTVAVWGCGPVGQFVIKCCYLLGAARVIAIDHFPLRLKMAEEFGGAIALNYDEVSLDDALRDLTGGMGPDSCIDAVGLEAYGHSIDAILDRFLVTTKQATDRGHVLREAIYFCRKGGTVSIPGVYGGIVDKIPMGAAFNKGLTFKMGQTHVPKYMPKLLEHIQNGDIVPERIISHRIPLDETPQGYAMFKEQQNECLKVVMKLDA